MLVCKSRLWVQRGGDVAEHHVEVGAHEVNGSMAVAPDSSFTKRETRFFIGNSMCARGWSN